jgi:hypothetical protein
VLLFWGNKVVSRKRIGHGIAARERNLTHIFDIFGSDSVMLLKFIIFQKKDRGKLEKERERTEGECKIEKKKKISRERESMVVNWGLLPTHFLSMVVNWGLLPTHFFVDGSELGLTPSA